MYEMNDAADKMILDELKTVKAQLESLQQSCIENKVRIDSNYESFKDFDKRLREAETKLVSLETQLENHKEAYKEEIEYQDNCNTDILTQLDQHKEDLKELQGEVNQLRMSLDRIKERHENSDKRREHLRGIMHPVISWIIIVILILITTAVFYTFVPAKNVTDETPVERPTIEKVLDGAPR